MVCVFPSLESIFLSLVADASLSSTSILELRPRFCGLTNQRLPAVTLGSSSPSRCLPGFQARFQLGCKRVVEENGHEGRLRNTKTIFAR